MRRCQKQRKNSGSTSVLMYSGSTPSVATHCFTTFGGRGGGGGAGEPGQVVECGGQRRGGGAQELQPKRKAALEATAQSQQPGGLAS
jgi:hypothetical protein